MTDKTEKEIAEIESIRKKEFVEQLSIQVVQTAVNLLPHRIEKLSTLPDDVFELELEKLCSQVFFVQSKVVDNFVVDTDLRRSALGNNLVRLDEYIAVARKNNKL